VCAASTPRPTGTVTFVFTDIEGSTRLLEELGREAYRDALDDHRQAVRAPFGRQQGYEVDYEGDGFFYAFPTADGAVTAADLKLPEGVEVINPDAHIATLSSSGRLEMEMTVSAGVGYRSADANKSPSTSIGVIPVDSIFSPVRKVAYRRFIARGSAHEAQETM